MWARRPTRCPVERRSSAPLFRGGLRSCAPPARVSRFGVSRPWPAHGRELARALARGSWRKMSGRRGHRRGRWLDPDLPLGSRSSAGRPTDPLAFCARRRHRLPGGEVGYPVPGSNWPVAPRRTPRACRPLVLSRLSTPPARSPRQRLSLNAGRERGPDGYSRRLDPAAHHHDVSRGPPGFPPGLSRVVCKFRWRARESNPGFRLEGPAS
jgi:hypothetical protein